MSARSASPQPADPGLAGPASLPSPPSPSAEPATRPAAASEPGLAGWPEPIGRPAQPHWWSVQKPPPAGPISARRAYTEVLAVFAAFFAAGIVAGAETLARRYPAPSGSWAVFTPAAVSEVTTAALAVAVTVLLSSRRGITPRTLGLGPPRKATGGAAMIPAFRTGVWALVILVAGGTITSALATGHLVQPTRPEGGYLLYATAASLAAGVVEETVVLAFVVTTLRQAGRPLLEILAVAIVLRCSYHDYYGPGVAGIAVWAAVFVWLFLRTGSVIPLIVVHFLWDASIFWGDRWHWLRAATAIAVFALIVLAIVSWLTEVRNRNRRGRSRPPAGRSGATYTAWPFADASPPTAGEAGEAREARQLYR